MSGFKYTKPLPEPLRQSQLSLVPAAVLVRYVEALRACRKSGLRIVPFETRRSGARQHWLWQQGREWAGDIVTQSPTMELSWHAVCALDSAFVKSDGTVFWPKAASIWEDFGSIMESHGLAWGGRWKRPDSPHVQASNTPTTPSEADQRLIAANDTEALWHKYDLQRVQYWDDPTNL